LRDAFASVKPFGVLREGVTSNSRQADAFLSTTRFAIPAPVAPNIVGVRTDTAMGLKVVNARRRNRAVNAVAGDA
jgi:hypothetical protein